MICEECGTDFAVHEYYWRGEKSMNIVLCDGCVQLSGLGPQLDDQCNMVDGVRVGDCREGE